jgi:hypothetical protein
VRERLEKEGLVFDERGRVSQDARWRPGAESASGA